MSTSPPSEQLRAATRAHHERIDQSAFAQAVADGSLSVPCYVSFLRAVQIVHRGLEEAVGLAGDVVLRSAYAHGVERRGRLERDLTYLQADPHAVDGAALSALVLAQRIRLDAHADPRTLFGHLYVVEGSQLGGSFQKRALEARPELQGGGLAYLAAAGSQTQGQFRAFVAKLEAGLPDEAAVECAIQGATHAFESFEAIVEAVMSPHREGPWLTDALNADAGTHPLPDDVREVQAALRAGEQTWQTWSYYQARYGERGLRFTRSDSCWLVTLARVEPQLTLHHVLWLARVLAARGMPRLLMERHLEQLHDALLTYVPGPATSYHALREATDALRKERRALLTDEQLEALAQEFRGAPEGAPIHPREAGMLLVAAVLDEKREVPNAVESLCGWLRDPTRCSPAWQQAVDRALERARAAC